MGISMNSPILKLANRVRFGIALLAALGLAACSSDSNGDFSSLINVAGSVFSTEAPPSVTLEQASAIPYATMGFRLGDAPEAVGILTSSSGSLLWTIGTQAAFVTRGGRLIQNAGLEHDLSGLRLDPATRFSPIALANGETADTDWSVDFSDRNIFSASMHCHAHATGPEDVTILGGVIGTVRVSETCHCPAVGWSFENLYWI